MQTPMLRDGTYLFKAESTFRVGHVDEPSRALSSDFRIMSVLAAIAAGEDPIETCAGLLTVPAIQEIIDAATSLGVLSHVERPALRDIATDYHEFIGTAADMRAHAEFLAAVELVKNYTLTCMPSMFATWTAACHVVERGVPGALVECGVWRGGSAMLMSLASSASRQVFLYDTFAWTWPEPSDRDGLIRHSGLYQPEGSQEHMSDGVSVAQVRSRLKSVGLDDDLLTIVQGEVERTLATTVPERIALLRLDTDFYGSTKVELERLYPLLSPGGVLIVDDYGKHAGPTRAVDDYFAEIGSRPLLVRIGNQGRMGVKC